MQPFEPYETVLLRLSVVVRSLLLGPIRALLIKATKSIQKLEFSKESLYSIAIVYRRIALQYRVYTHLYTDESDAH